MVYLSHKKHMVYSWKIWTFRTGVFIIMSMDQGLLVYKVDNPVQSSLLNSLRKQSLSKRPD